MSRGFEFGTVGGPRPVDVVRAVGVRHAFRRHLHRRGVICRLDAGVRRFVLAGVETLAAAGDVVVIPTGVPHAAEPVRDAAHSYRVISCAGPFPAAAFVTRSRGVRAAFDRAFRALQRGDAAAAEALAALLSTRADARPAAPARRRARLDRVRALIEERHPEPLPLRALAEAVRMSPFTLNRAFREQYGLPPHEYLQLVRVKRAQDLLRRSDRPLAELAFDLGFADQAHLTRLFKRYVGVPPGAWRCTGRCLPYRPSAHPGSNAATVARRRNSLSKP